MAGTKFNFKKITDGLMKKTVPAAAGGAAAIAIDKVAPAMQDKLNPYLRFAIKLGIAGMIPSFSKTPAAQSFADGFAGATGAQILAKVVPSMAGVEGVESVGDLDEEVELQGVEEGEMQGVDGVENEVKVY